MAKRLPTMARLGIAHLTWKRYLERNLLPLGINLKQSYVLGMLAENEFLYPAEIAGVLFCDRPTATVIIGNMERKGWVGRERDPENARRVRVRLLDGGRHMLEKVAAVAAPPFDPLSCLTPEEKAELDRLLKRVCEHLSVLNPEADGSSRG